jgi:hypothetical protein
MRAAELGGWEWWGEWARVRSLGYSHGFLSENRIVAQEEGENLTTGAQKITLSRI